MIRSASTPRGFNIDWSVRPRADGDADQRRYDYRPSSIDRDVSADEASDGATKGRPNGRALRPPPPAWRARRADMSRKAFLSLVCGWAGAVLVLLITVLLIRLHG